MITAKYAKAVVEHVEATAPEAFKTEVEELLDKAWVAIESAAATGWEATKLDCNGIIRPVVLAVQVKLRAAGFAVTTRLHEHSEESDTMYIYWHVDLV